jgi:hypothetical protein
MHVSKEPARTRRTSSRMTCGLLLATMLWSCASTVSIDSLHPRPDIRLPRQERSLCLLLDPSIRAQHRIAPANGVPEVVIERWRQALEQAFVHGMGTSFTLGRPDPELCMRLTVVNLSFAAEPEASAAMVMADARKGELPIHLAHGGPSSPRLVRARKRPSYARIDYAAELLDGQGKVLRQVTGTVVEHHPVDETRASIAHAIESAIQSMYEMLSKQLFENESVAWHKRILGFQFLPQNGEGKNP